MAQAQLILPFEFWKVCLRKDCQDHHQLREFDSLDESVLRLLWQQGLKPSVQAIVDDGENVDKPFYTNRVREQSADVPVQTPLLLLDMRQRS